MSGSPYAKNWAVLALITNATIWGLSWLPLRYLNTLGIHALWSTVAVSLFATLWVFSSQKMKFSDFLHHPALWVLFTAAGFTNVFFNWGVTIGDVTRVVLLFYLMPAWATIFAWFILREPLSATALLQLLLSLTGVVLVLRPASEGLPLPSSLADYLGLAGGMCFALTNVMLRKLRDIAPSSRMLAMFGGGFVIALLALLIGLGSQSIAWLPAWEWRWASVLLLFCALILVGNLCLQYGTSHLLIKTVSLLMLTEVVVATVSSSIAGASQISPYVLLGGALIALSTVWSILHHR